MRVLTCPPEAEIIGVTLSSFYDNLQGPETSEIMARHGISDIEPFDWYSLEPLLSALNEIAHNTNVVSNMVAIGMKIGEVVPMPPELGDDPTMEQVLMVWDDLYQSLHRNGDVGEIKIEKVSETHFKTYHSVMYPDDMSYGVLYAYGRRFLPSGTHFTVFFDPDVTPRDKGGDGEYTIIDIKWEE